MSSSEISKEIGYARTHMFSKIIKNKQGQKEDTPSSLTKTELEIAQIIIWFICRFYTFLKDNML